MTPFGTVSLLLLHLFNGRFARTSWVSWNQKSTTSLDLNKARDDGVLGCSGISWTICKQSARCTRRITTPTPDHSTNSVKAMTKNWIFRCWELKLKTCVLMLSSFCFRLWIPCYILQTVSFKFEFIVVLWPTVSCFTLWSKLWSWTVYCQQDGAAGDAADDAEDDTEEDGEETALEGYETVLDKVDNPVHEYQMFRGTLFSMMMFTLHTHTHTHLTALCLGLPGWAGTRKVNQCGFYWSKRQWVAVASAGPYASLHLAPDR